MLVGRLDYYSYDILQLYTQEKEYVKMSPAKISSSQLAKKSSLSFAFNTVHWSGFEHF
jgi:hypothetical protein